MRHHLLYSLKKEEAISHLLMEKGMEKENSTDWFGAIVLLIFGLLAMYWGFLVLHGIFNPLLFAVIFAVVFYPLYHFFLQKTKSEKFASALTCFILLLLVLMFISLAVYLAVGEVVSITKVFTQNLDLQNLYSLRDQEQFQSLVDQTIATLNALLGKIPFIDTSVSDILTEFLKNIPVFLQEVSTYLVNFIRLSLDSAAKWLVQMLIFFISLFFLLIDGKQFLSYAFQLLPINALHERQISKRFSNLCYAWIVVSLSVAVIQGILAAIGFWIVGIPSPMIWGIVTMFASFIPFFGTAVIWITMAVIYIILGYYGSGIFLIIWGATLIGSSDNILRPFLLKEGVKIHPLILFLAVLGGFFAFGVAGLVIGPLVMVFISTLLYIYELEFQEKLDHFHHRHDG